MRRMKIGTKDGCRYKRQPARRGRASLAAWLTLVCPILAQHVLCHHWALGDGQLAIQKHRDLGEYGAGWGRSNGALSAACRLSACTRERGHRARRAGMLRLCASSTLVSIPGGG